MSDTSLQTAPAPVPAVAAGAAAPPVEPRPKARRNPLLAVVETAGSLRLTVTLFALSLVLVFFGTLAQIDGGIWTIVNQYFRSVLVWVPVQLLVKFGQIFFSLPKSWLLPNWVAIPFPGGLTLGTLLLVNLFCAYSLRVPGYMKHWKNYALMGAVLVLDCVLGYVAVVSLSQWQSLGVLALIAVVNVAALWPFYKVVFFPGNRIGIFTLHIGMVLMLVGEFITAYGAIEGNMVIEEGETTNVVIHNRYIELAVVDPSDEKTDTVTVVPGRLLRKGGAIAHDELPFDIEVVRWLGNSKMAAPTPDDENPADTGFGKERLAVELSEVAGASTKQTVETPSVYAKLTDRKTGKELGTYLFSVLLKEQKISAGGKDYEVSLRFKQTYKKKYSLELVNFTFARYPGTNTPKDFASEVILRDEETGDNRQVTIRMNSPLRHRGDTFFQADWNKETEAGTVLQVVRNPAWQLPYWSCAIVTVGMLIHFGLNLINFLGRRGGA